MDGVRFGKDTLHRPPQPPRIFAGSSSEKEINFQYLPHLNHCHHCRDHHYHHHLTLEREGLESSTLESATYTASPTCGEIILYLWRNTFISLQKYFYISAEILHLWRNASNRSSIPVEKYFYICAEYGMYMNWFDFDLVDSPSFSS